MSAMKFYVFHKLLGNFSNTNLTNKKNHQLQDGWADRTAFCYACLFCETCLELF